MSAAKPISESLGYGITCIDANYIRHGLACFYLMEQDGECAIIETGTAHSVANLQQVIAAKGITAEQVRYVIPTHVHLDHAGGAGAMMATFPHATLLIHPRGARHMIDPARLIASSQEVYGPQKFHQLYGEVQPIKPGRIQEMEDGQAVSLAGRRLEFRHTRGHADHHFCVWDEMSQGWFSGDMFGISYPWFRFASGDFLLPTTTPTQFSPQDFLASLETLASYQPQRVYLTHYGELVYSNELANTLGQQVKAYRDLATTCQGDKVALEQVLTDYSLNLMQELDTGMSDVALRELLAFDMDLNALGLQVWLQRSALAS